MYRTHLDKLTRTRLDDFLVDEGVLDRARLEAAQAETDQSGALLSDVLVDSGALDEWDLAKLVASHYALPFIDVKLYSIQPAVLELLPLDWCRKHSLLPLDQFGKTISMACAEVPSQEVVEEIAQKTGCTPFLFVGLRRAMRDVIDENSKRRSSRPAPTKAQGAGAGKAPAAQSPAVPDEPPPIPDDLPRVSLQLNASAANCGRKSVIERFGRPTTPTAASAVPAPSPPPAFSPRATVPAVPARAPAATHAAPPAATSSVPPLAPQTRPQAASPTAPTTVPPTAIPTVQKVSAMQQILGRKAGPNGAATAPPAVPSTKPPATKQYVPPTPAATNEDPPKPKLANRAAPVLPAAAGASAAGTPARPAAGPHGEWESIFDIGEEAVRTSHPGDARGANGSSG